MDVWERLDAVLFSNDEELVVYVYRLDAYGNVVKPYLLKCEAWEGLCMMLKDDYDGGDFKLLIRKRRKMVFSGEISIVSPSTLGRRSG